MDFCTLGMFIIDDIYPAASAEDNAPRLNVIGGAGTYSAVGARLFCPHPLSSAVGWIVDAGTDFPDDIRQTLLSWQTSLVLRPRDGLTTRGWNGYSGNELRDFKYLTEKKRITADDLTPALLAAKSFHFICSAMRCEQLVKCILERRPAELPKPLFIWEPVPDLCITSELDNVKKALGLIDVMSPNHDELASLFDAKHTDVVNAQIVEDHAQTLLACGIGHEGRGSIVVRCGKLGSLAASREQMTWIPAYHTDQSKVTDPTGGGNGFLGGLAIGLVKSNDIKEATIFGSIAASFCIEQVGMPVLDQSGTEELWNGHNVSTRLQEFRDRLS